MNFRIRGLSPEPFAHLFGLSEQELALNGVKRYVANEAPGFPDRIEMRDARIGESLLLLNHEYQPAATPYKASHAIFILEHAKDVYDKVNEVPDVMRIRLLSLRAFDVAGMMLDADVVEGEGMETLIEQFFDNEKIAYIHAHNAKRGCFSGRIDRA